MNYHFLLRGIKNVLFNPSTYWLTIHSENTSIKLIRNSFLLPLAMLLAFSLITGSLFFYNTELLLAFSILLGIKGFLVLIATAYIAAYILKEITYPLDLGRDFNISFRLIVYSLTPFILCKLVSSVFESLLFINIIGLYGLYIFWTGAEIMLKPPHYKRIPLLISTTVILIGVFVVTDIVLTMLTEKLYYTYFA